MGGPSAFLGQLQQRLAAFDDQALAALASPGLLRRARKDLDGAVLGPVGSGWVEVLVDQQTVRLVEPIHLSRCTCPSHTLCRHILTAILLLSQHAPAAPPDPAQIQAVSLSQLHTWAGKALVRRAQRQTMPVEVHGLEARFPWEDVTCRWMAGGGLEGMVCDCHAPPPCLHQVLLVLAHQRLLQPPTPHTTPPGTADLLGAIEALLSQAVTLGLGRLSQASAERLRSLAVSAHGLDLPRLERMLRQLAQESQDLLGRSARSSPPRWLAQAARLQALCQALRQGRPVQGEHRTKYYRVAQLELIGLGAEPWKTGSGYQGLTVYFWDVKGRRWASWSDARPLSLESFDPVLRYRYVGPWEGCPSPWKACRGHWRLQQAQRSPEGRLSGAPPTRAVPLGEAPVESVPAERSWDVLTQRARGCLGGGLIPPQPLETLVLLQPDLWGPARFLQTHQELIQPLLDQEGRSLISRLAYSPWTEAGLKLLENHTPPPGSRLLAHLALGPTGLEVRPIALHQPSGLINLGLTEGTSSLTAAPAAAASAPAAASSRLDNLLLRLQGQLEALTEAGLTAPLSLEGVRRSQQQAAEVGLTYLAASLESFLSHLAQLRRDGQGAPGRELLRASYLTGLYRAQEELTGADAGGLRSF